jgi:hypothetical protein
MRIAKLGNFYLPDLQGDNSAKILEDNFDTIEDAKNEIEKMESEIYVLSHNEFGRPDYYVIDDNDAEYLETGRNYDMGNYDWGNYTCNCGECNKCIEMMIRQDRQFVIDNAIKDSVIDPRD